MLNGKEVVTLAVELKQQARHLMALCEKCAVCVVYGVVFGLGFGRGRELIECRAFSTWLASCDDQVCQVGLPHAWSANNMKKGGHG